METETSFIIIFFPTFFIIRRNLLESCWRYDPEERACIGHLRNQLLLKPSLVQPCLDAPRSAVDHSDHDEDEHFHDMKRSSKSNVSGIAEQQQLLHTSPTNLSIASEQISQPDQQELKSFRQNDNVKVDKIKDSASSHRSQTISKNSILQHLRPSVIRSPLGRPNSIEQNQTTSRTNRTLMRTISNPMDMLVTNPDLVQFTFNGQDKKALNGSATCNGIVVSAGDGESGGIIALESLKQEENDDDENCEVLWENEIV